MSRRLTILALGALLNACGGDLLPPLARPDADVRLELAARKVQADEALIATVTVIKGDGVELELGQPGAEGLETAVREKRGEPFEGYHLSTITYELSGEPGSYVVSLPPPHVVHPDGREEDLEVPAVFADIGVDGPSSQLEGLLVPEPPEPARWPWVLLVAAVSAAIGGGAVSWWRSRKRATRTVSSEPPDVLAHYAWRAVMADKKLDDHARALQLSEVFRRYLEAVHPMPATALTSREITDIIYRDGLVPGGLLDRARRILMATDLLKFARRGGGIEFFHELDRDFRAYLEATRPRQLGEPGEGGRHG